MAKRKRAATRKTTANKTAAPRRSHARKGPRKKRRAAGDDGPVRRMLRQVVRVALLAAGLWLLFEAWRFPDVAALATSEPGKTSFMRYRERAARERNMRYRIQQRWASLGRISPHLRQAVLAAEDDRFYQHDGFDLDEIRNAVESSVKDGKALRGASTISQQLTKNLWLTPERTLTRKLREAAYTYVLEKRLSKERILEIYLNVVEWGPGVFGAEAAARYYFKTSAARLDRSEAALLAAALPNPLARNPAKPSRSHRRRAKRIEARMSRRSGSPTPVERQPLKRSRATPAKVRPRPSGGRPRDVLLGPGTPASVTPARTPAVTPTPKPSPTKPPSDLLRPEP